MSVVDLTGCNIIEHDVNNEVLWAWAFPNVTKQKQEFVLRKYNDIIDQSQSFAFARYGKEWCYLITSQASESDALSQVKEFALVVWSNDYNPEKYETLSRVLSKRYSKTGNPSMVLQLYLTVVMQGVCNVEENGTSVDLESRKNASSSHIKDLIKLFGLETILIYTALLLNKKLVIYHHSLENLLEWVRTFPSLMLHRNFDDSTFPWLHLVPDELEELKSKDGYIVGSTDSAVASHSDLYDILVNVPAREITIAPHTRESFSMTKTHKDIALFMVQLSEKANADEKQVVEEISNKTKELLRHLRMLATTSTPDGRKVISIETLRNKNLPPALENFLFNLSVAENMIML